MKRVILVTSFLLTFTGIVSPARASTDGCPNDWKIDTSNANSIQELQAAKQRLGSDMAIDEGILQYTNYSGNLGSLNSPKNGSLNFEDVYLYGNTQVSKKYRVQVKGCETAVDFVFKLGTLKDSLSIKSLLTDVNASDWARNNQQSFSDFVKAGQFGECITNIQERLSTPGKIRAEKVGNNLNFIAVNIMQPLGFKACDLRGGGLFLEDLNPGCRWVNPAGVLPSRMGVTMKIGNSCEVALALLVNTGDLILFKKFIIDSKRWQISLKCVKGNTTKLVSGIYGYDLKCPVGYKKK